MILNRIFVEDGDGVSTEKQLIIGTTNISTGCSFVKDNVLGWLIELFVDSYIDLEDQKRKGLEVFFQAVIEDETINLYVIKGGKTDKTKVEL